MGEPTVVWTDDMDVNVRALIRLIESGRLTWESVEAEDGIIGDREIYRSELGNGWTILSDAIHLRILNDSVEYHCFTGYQYRGGYWKPQEHAGLVMSINKHAKSACSIGSTFVGATREFLAAQPKEGKHAEPGV